LQTWLHFRCHGGEVKARFSGLWIVELSKEGKIPKPISERVSMGWAAEYFARLQNGDTVQFRPKGHSLRGKIESGQLCTVEPVDTAILKVGDIVLCKVKGKHYLHLIKAIQGNRFQIGNNRGHINGWVGGNSVYGKCTRIE
jgi:hypothetical protein